MTHIKTICRDCGDAALIPSDLVVVSLERLGVFYEFTHCDRTQYRSTTYRAAAVLAAAGVRVVGELVRA